MDIYNKIFDFCKARNPGMAGSGDGEPTPRVKFITDLLDSLGIEYELDTFEREVHRPRRRIMPMNRYLRHFSDFDLPEDSEEPKRTSTYFNIIMRGKSNRMIMAHHDIVNPNIDNANDNSASVINVIATKILRPDINVAIVDGEEIGGIGSSRVGEQIKNGDFGDIEWVLNFELTGKGGKHFFIGDYPGKLTDHITKIFDCPIINTPFNDAVTIRRFGIDAVVINPIPPLPKGEKSAVKWDDETYLDHSMLFNCHNSKDSLSSIDPADMKEFVEQVILKII